MCADLVLPTDETTLHFCVLYFVQNCPGGSSLAVEFGLSAIFCAHIKDSTRRHAQCMETERRVDEALKSLRQRGYVSAVAFPALTDNGQNYLASLMVPDADRYRPLLETEAKKLAPSFVDLPGQLVGVFY